jgi:hypothetical protein
MPAPQEKPPPPLRRRRSPPRSARSGAVAAPPARAARVASSWPPGLLPPGSPDTLPGSVPPADLQGECRWAVRDRTFDLGIESLGKSMPGRSGWCRFGLGCTDSGCRESCFVSIHAGLCRPVRERMVSTIGPSHVLPAAPAVEASKAMFGGTLVVCNNLSLAAPPAHWEPNANLVGEARRCARSQKPRPDVADDQFDPGRTHSQARAPPLWSGQGGGVGGVSRLLSAAERGEVAAEADVGCVLRDGVDAVV